MFFFKKKIITNYHNPLGKKKLMNNFLAIVTQMANFIFNDPEGVTMTCTLGPAACTAKFTLTANARACVLATDGSQLFDYETTSSYLCTVKLAPQFLHQFRTRLILLSLKIYPRVISQCFGSNITTHCVARLFPEVL